MKPRILVVAIALAMAGCSSSDNTAEPSNDIPAGGDSNPLPGGSGAGDNPAGEGATADPLALELIGQNLLVSLAGFQADRLSLSVRVLASEIATIGEAMSQPASTFETLDGFGPEVVVSPTQVTVYTCDAGGQMTHETGRLRSGVGTDRSLLADHDVYTFDGCRHTQVGGVITNGDYQLDGELVMDAFDYSASRGGRSGLSNSWTGFTVSVPGALAFELSGSVDASSYSAANFGSGDSRTVELSSYRKTSGVETVESLTGAQLSLVRAIPNGSNESSYELNAAGVISNAATDSVLVTISTESPLSGSGVDSQGMSEPFNGQIDMLSADGGQLFLSANPASQISIAPGDLLVDLLALRPDGESVAADAVPLIDILSGGVTGGCFLIDSSADDCGLFVLP